MSIIYHCDRCDVTSPKRTDIIAVEVTMVEPYKNEPYERRMDLCISCLRSVYEWAKKLPKVAEGK